MSYVFVCLECGAEHENRPREQCDVCGAKRFDVVYSVGDVRRC